MIVVYLLTYFAVLLFIILVVSKIVKYASTPVHVRWELYPVAHEPKRNKYGGSYYEEPEWWKHKAKKNHIAELWAMFEEIVFLKGVYHHNKKLWYFSFPFHFSLYLIVVTFFLVFAEAILDIFSVISLFNSYSVTENILSLLTNICGYAGLVLTFIGCIGLIIQRATDKKFKFYNAPMDFVNLFFILILVIFISLTLFLSNPSFQAQLLPF